MQAIATAELPSRISHERVLVVFGGLLLVMLLAALDSTIFATALTEEGCEIYNRLAAARRERLAELWPEWSPKKREEDAEILRRLARELIPETTAA
jgi:hypothetical protein